MFIDLIVDRIPKEFKKTRGFNPIDEPLLGFIFKSKEYQSQAIAFNKKLVLPAPELLLAMKINSLPNRDKEHKKIKDLCDIFAILWYSNLDSAQVKEKLRKLVPERNIRKCLAKISRKDLQKAGPQISHIAEEIRRVLELIS